MSVDDYLARVLSFMQPLPPVMVPLLEALGLVLAEDVQMPRDMPAFDNSSMDGYAVISGDLEAVPTHLRVIEDIPAGAVPRATVTRGTAARIMTGAPMPAGADAVVRVEWTDGGTETVEVQRTVAPGNDIRRAGEDLREGQTVLIRGTVVTPRTIALLASCDREQMLVHPRPRVTVISTGDELVPAGQPVGAGQIVDSNGPLLVACVQDAGAVVTHQGPVADHADDFRAVLQQALAHSDLIITSGGVSMGAYDTVKEVLGAAGGVEFSKVAMNPGMPQGCGQLDGIPIITLPGNPVSTYVSFEVFVRPALRTLMGRPDVHRPLRTATTLASFGSPAAKRQFARGVLDGFDDCSVAPVRGQGSHMLSGLSEANCLMVIPEEVTEVAAGSVVTVIDLR